MAKCNSCGAEIYWLKNQKTSKPAPIDAQPSPTGNILVDQKTSTYAVIGPKELPRYQAMLPAGKLYTNHFVTCPQSRQWAHHGGRGMR